MKLIIKDERRRINAFGCFGLAYLCNGRNEIALKKECYEDLIVRLDLLISSLSCESCRRTIAAVTALGAIVRWASYFDIEVIIKRNARISGLKKLLAHRDKCFQKYGCWLVSMIVAGTEKHIKTVIDSGMIDLLVHIAETCKFLNVKKEAAWAILNVIFGTEPNQIEDLKHRCVKPLWYLVELFSEFEEIVSPCLRALVRLEGVEVTRSGEPIDLAIIKDYLGSRLQETNIPLTNDDVLSLNKLKILRHANSMKKSDDKMVFHVTRRVQEDMHDSQIILGVYDSFEEVLMNFLVDKPKTED